MTLHDTGTEPSTRAPPRRDRQRPALPGGISMRPAMVVLGLAVLILVVFVTIGIVTTQSPQRGEDLEHPDRGVPGHHCRPPWRPGSSRRSSSRGEPPTNILNAVSIPVGSVRIVAPEQRGGIGPVRRPGDLPLRRLPGGPPDLLRRRHEVQGWQIFDKGAGRQTTRARSRSWASWPALTATTGRWGRSSRRRRSARRAPPAGWTNFTIRLFQQSDDES